MNTKLTLLGFLSLVLLAGSAVSSPGEYEKFYLQRGPMPFEAMDLNGDGVISTAEHAKVRSERHAARMNAGYRMRNVNKATGFEQADLDGNGTLTRDELAKCQSRRFQKHW